MKKMFEVGMTSI